jgi:UDP-N-acetylglucosamine--N-acetylmuramyl-(pentapeptide) pyrophosphoryl-undecaprenol N-acetylglucosamine transferase
MSQKHLVIAGGGTGGHLFPGVAVVEAALELDPNLKVTFVGAQRGIEARVIPELGFDLKLLPVHPLRSGGAIGALKGASSLPWSGVKALQFIAQLKPDVVVAVGGYAAGPMTALAAMSGKKTALLEQNAVPGLTNRWLGKFVDRAYLSFESTAEYFPRVDCRAVGNPVRKSIRDRVASVHYETPVDRLNILVIGGSGGSQNLNMGIPKALSQLSSETRGLVSVRHQTGRGRMEMAQQSYQGYEGKYELTEFIDDMAAAYAWCDLLICRAGMSTIAEVTALGIPAIYVPLPTSDGHQIANALEIVEKGGGMMIPDDEISSARMARLVEGLVRNPVSLGQVSAQARQLGHPDAAITIATELLDWVK